MANKATKHSPNRKTLTVAETAERLGIGINAAYAAIKAGEIPHLRIGARIIVPRVALEKKLEGMDA